MVSSLYDKPWIIQGGYVDASGSTSPSDFIKITFPKKFINNLYTTLVCSGIGASGWQYANGATAEDFHTSYFRTRVATGSGNTRFNWRCEGQAT